MNRAEYRPLSQARLERGAAYHLPDAFVPTSVRLDSPAVEVMTDLRRIPAATIDPDVAVEDANRVMILRAVRLLLVTDDERKVVGLITAVDILGEKPMQVMRQRGVQRSEVRVQDIMVPYDRLDVLSMADVLRAEVGHVVATLKRAGRQHALVVDTDAEGRSYIRGIFSATQIARQMGIPISTHEVARTFAEIEAAIAGH